jgi:hypothetical protein
MPSYPSGMTVSNQALITVSGALRRTRNQRWRRLSVGEQALLVLTHAMIEALRASGHLELIRLLALESATGRSPVAHARYAAAVDDLVGRS